MSGLLDMFFKKLNPQATEDDEDQWSDVTSSEGASSPSKDGHKVDDSLGTHELLGKDTAQYLAYMPSVLGKDLPPCGLEPQVAYENVNARLRKRWLYFRGKKSVVDVCQVVKDDLDNQKVRFPPFSLPNRQSQPEQQRTPWRREAVFAYETRWIDYFLREAQAVEPMTESELISHAEQPCVPKELHLQCNKKNVLALWNAWHAKKRAPSPMMPDAATESGLRVASSQMVGIADWENKNPVSSGLLGESAVVVEGEETAEDIKQGLCVRANS